MILIFFTLYFIYMYLIDYLNIIYREIEKFYIVSSRKTPFENKHIKKNYNIFDL